MRAVATAENRPDWSYNQPLHMDHMCAAHEDQEDVQCTVPSCQHRFVVTRNCVAIDPPDPGIVSGLFSIRIWWIPYRWRGRRSCVHPERDGDGQKASRCKLPLPAVPDARSTESARTFRHIASTPFYAAYCTSATMRGWELPVILLDIIHLELSRPPYTRSRRSNAAGRTQHSCVPRTSPPAPR